VPYSQACIRVETLALFDIRHSTGNIVSVHIGVEVELSVYIGTETQETKENLINTVRKIFRKNTLYMLEQRLLYHLVTRYTSLFIASLVSIK